jgi:GntR family transcriptional regulator
MSRRDRQTVVQGIHAGILRTLDESGLKPGDQIPTEAELKAQLGGSRPAIREALRLLEQDGLIHTVHGRGRFLTAVGSLHIDRPITAFESISDMAANLGYKLENVVLSVGEELPAKDVSDALGLEKGKTVIRLERLRTGDRTPLIYCVDFIRRDVIPDRIFDIDWSGSLLDLLATHGARPRMSRAQVRAETLPEDVVRRHGLVDFGPALRIDETCLTLEGMPVLMANCFHRGSHFSFSLLRK